MAASGTQGENPAAGEKPEFFIKKIPPSGVAPSFKLSLPHHIGSYDLSLLVGRDFNLAVSPYTDKVWPASVVARQNKGRAEYSLKGWKLFAEAHRVQQGEQYSFELRDVGMAMRLTIKLLKGAGGADEDEDIHSHLLPHHSVSAQGFHTSSEDTSEQKPRMEGPCTPAVDSLLEQGSFEDVLPAMSDGQGGDHLQHLLILEGFGWLPEVSHGVDMSSVDTSMLEGLPEYHPGSLDDALNLGTTPAGPDGDLALEAAAYAQPEPMLASSMENAGDIARQTPRQAECNDALPDLGSIDQEMHTDVILSWTDRLHNRVASVANSITDMAEDDMPCHGYQAHPAEALASPPIPSELQPLPTGDGQLGDHGSTGQQLIHIGAQISNLLLSIQNLQSTMRQNEERVERAEKEKSVLRCELKSVSSDWRHALDQMGDIGRLLKGFNTGASRSKDQEAHAEAFVKVKAAHQKLEAIHEAIYKFMQRLHGETA